MANHVIPKSISRLQKPKEDIERIKKLYINWKSDEITQLVLEGYIKDLKQLVVEDEKENWTTWFQTKWNRAKRLGNRETIRKIISDLGGHV